MTPREFDRVVRKFGMEIIEGGNHRRARFHYRGRIVLSTLRSRSPGEFTDFQVRTQLRLTPAQLRDAIRCTLSRDDYIAILRDRGLIRD